MPCDKKKDNKMFKRSKVRRSKYCDECDIPRITCSTHDPGSAKSAGQENKNVDKIEQLIENEGYVCGEDIPGKRFYMQCKLQCFNHV